MKKRKPSAYHSSKTFFNSTPLVVAFLSAAFSITAQTQAALLTIDSQTPQTQILDNGQDTPVLFISPPNIDGVSYNRFEDFQLDERGLNIVNNFELQTDGSNSQEIREIVIAVASYEPLLLKGTTQITGPATDLTLTQVGTTGTPPTVTCNGCRFRNIKDLRLATGEVMFNVPETTKISMINDGAIEINEQGMYLEDVASFSFVSEHINNSGIIKMIQPPIESIPASGSVDLKATSLYNHCHRPETLSSDPSTLYLDLTQYDQAPPLFSMDKAVSISSSKVPNTSAHLVLRKSDEGHIFAGSDFSISTSLTLANQGAVSNSRSVMMSSNPLELQENDEGLIVAGSDLSKSTSGILTNHGTVLNSRSVRMSSKPLELQENDEGHIFAGSDLSISTSGTLTNQGAVSNSRSVMMSSKP